MTCRRGTACRARSCVAIDFTIAPIWGRQRGLQLTRRRVRAMLSGKGEPQKHNPELNPAAIGGTSSHPSRAPPQGEQHDLKNNLDRCSDYRFEFSPRLARQGSEHTGIELIHWAGMGYNLRGDWCCRGRGRCGHSHAQIKKTNDYGMRRLGTERDELDQRKRQAHLRAVWRHGGHYAR